MALDLMHHGDLIKEGIKAKSKGILKMKPGDYYQISRTTSITTPPFISHSYSFFGTWNYRSSISKKRLRSSSLWLWTNVPSLAEGKGPPTPPQWIRITSVGAQMEVWMKFLPHCHCGCAAPCGLVGNWSPFRFCHKTLTKWDFKLAHPVPVSIISHTDSLITLSISVIYMVQRSR